MGRLALIGGSGLVRPGFGALETGGDHVVLQRHGREEYLLPHEIDHGRNAAELAGLGCDRALALCSVGSLRADLPVGTWLAPDDFIALGVSPSAFDDARAHTIPGFDRGWRTRVLSAFAGQSETIVDGGVYWQSRGPRFETPAEIRLFAEHAHVVGMTLGGEVSALCEQGIAVAAICVVDNMANGIGSSPLTLAKFEAGQAASAGRLLEALSGAIGDLA